MIRINTWSRIASLTALLTIGACSSDVVHLGAPAESRAQLFEGMGPHTRSVSTRSPEAQTYFNQGLNWTYAFNHDEAIRSFERAAQADPNLAIAWWGVALCYGPHINFPILPEEKARRAWDALEHARALRANANEREQALIDALGARYAWPAPEDRSSLDHAYAAAMRTVHARFPDDHDITTLYAESLMDLQPWDFWTHQGQPKGNALEVVALLESVLRVNPRHPGAAHLYIHAVEASPNPEKALGAANTLRFLVPASGHLSHMPSHIDIRVGQWPEAAEANRRAQAIDTKYRRLSPGQDFYNAYMTHNSQFLSFTCMMMGRSREAISAGKHAVDILPPEWVKANAGGIDGYMIVHMEALKRFGRWDEILRLNEPPDYLPFTRAMWRYTRAVALAAMGDISAARSERDQFARAVAAVPAESRAQINPASTVLELAGHVLDGEIAYAERDYTQAVAHLRAALPIEASLQYMEPPDWMQPVRHTLGVVLLDAGRLDEAEAAYREDLARWPGNGWSLLGLSRVQERMGHTDAARQTKALLAKAWADADIKPHASCLCAPRAAR